MVHIIVLGSGTGGMLAAYELKDEFSDTAAVLFLLKYYVKNVYRSEYWKR